MTRCAIWFFVAFVFVTGCNSGGPAFGPDDLLDTKIPAWRTWQTRSPAEIAKRLNFFVHNYCTFQSPLETDPNKIYENCRVLCGGYATVLVGLLTEMGIPARHVSLYNVPKQGNHSLVEAEIAPGVWALFDPTFGTYFTATGAHDDAPLSLDGLYQFPEGDMPSLILTARDLGIEQVDEPLTTLFASGEFPFDTFSPEDYRIAEDYGPNAPETQLSLRLPISATDGNGEFGTFVSGEEAADAEFLTLTNWLLNNVADHTKHVSYWASRIGALDRGEFRPRLELEGLVPGDPHVLELWMEASATMGVGATARTGTVSPTSFTVPPGNATRTLTIVPATDTMWLDLRTLHGELGRVFGIRLHH